MVSSKESNNMIQQSSVKQRGWKFFFVRLFYMLALSFGLAYTLLRSSGQGILESFQETASFFTAQLLFVPLVFIIGFALAMWKFWYSIPWFILATVIVNSLIFGFNGDALGLSIYEVLIFLGVTLVVFALERGFSAISRKWIRISLALLPFIIMFFIILFTYFDIYLLKQIN